MLTGCGVTPVAVKLPTIWYGGWPAFFFNFVTYLTEADDESLWWRNVIPRWSRAGNDNVSV